MIIHIDFQGEAIFGEGGGQEIQISQEDFPLVEFGADKQAAAIIEHIEHGPERFGGREPGMGGSIQLPKFPDAGALEAQLGGGRARFGFGGRITVRQRPMAHLGAVQFEAVQAQRFGSNKAIGGRRAAGEAFAQQGDDRRGPVGGVIAAGGTRLPLLLAVVTARGEVLREELIKAAAPQAQLGGSLGRRQFAVAVAGQDMPHVRRRTATG